MKLSRQLKLSRQFAPFRVPRAHSSLLLVTFVTFVAVLGCVSVSTSTFGREKKEYDSDVNYDEGKIPHYDLPPSLVSEEGKKITTTDEWMNIRRPQILALFSNIIYGRVPPAPSPIKTSYEVVKVDRSFLQGKATRKDIKIRFENDNGSASMHVLLFVPNAAIQAGEKVPVFMKHSFNDTEGHDFNAHLLRKGRFRNGWPIGMILNRGYGFCAVHQTDLVGHNEVSWQGGIAKLFYPKGQSFPKAREWGCLTVVAWGASRALDYLETDEHVDAKRVSLMGHSKMGKATLWTAAQDQRFALAISAQSGCAGAALWRRKSGETLQKMCERFPYWLCRNAWKFIGQEDDLPVDQHMLLALIAPRPVYVASGIEDTWADPRGEYASAYHASEVYRLLGKKGLTSPKLPELGKAILDSDVGYHVREGGHSVEDYDWERFIDFCDRHLKKAAK